MKTTRIIATLIFYILSNTANGQTFEKSFQGWWARTNWTFEFYKDSTYKRISLGHFGNTTVEGKYQIKRDTITLLKGFNQSYGTVNETYIFDKDSFLIDLDLRYDYAPTLKDKFNNYNSKLRQIKYPQTDTKNQNIKSELETVLNLAFNTETAKNLFRFDKFPKRQLLLASYFSLNSFIKVDSLQCIYRPIHKIKEKFFIEFEDINQNSNRIEINIKIHGENTRIWFYYFKKEGKWVSQKPFVIEN